MDVSRYLSKASLWVPTHACSLFSRAGHVPFAFWLVDKLRPEVIVQLGSISGNAYLSYCQAVKRLSLATHCFAVEGENASLQAAGPQVESPDPIREVHDRGYADFSRLLWMRTCEALE